MTPSDLIYRHTFKEFISLGYSDRDAGEVAAKAVRLWRRNVKHKDAVSRAITEGKKLYKRVGR